MADKPMTPTGEPIPALSFQSEHYPLRFEGRVPRRVRALQFVGADWPLCTFPENKGLYVERGGEYDAWTNSHGAVAAILPDGRTLGLKPDEFEVTSWCDATPEANR